MVKRRPHESLLLDVTRDAPHLFELRQVDVHLGRREHEQLDALAIRGREEIDTTPVLALDRRPDGHLARCRSVLRGLPEW